MLSPRAARLAGLSALTAVAILLMVVVSFRTSRPREEPEARVAPPVLVAVADLAPETVEITATYSGMIEPWERYTLAFEVAGRVESLGTRPAADRLQDLPLDEGDAVAQGDVLARLDDRALQARYEEARARLEQARAELERARRLKEAGSSAISAQDFLTRETNVEVAQAQFELARKNLDDATLRAPVDGVIARRMVNPGESVTPQQAVFQIVETDRVLLVLGVPESRIVEINRRRRAVRNPLRGPVELASTDPRRASRDQGFQAYVELLGRDQYGRAWPEQTGEVHRVSETADERTGLFEVEVALPNPDRLLKAGMVARARLVTDVVEAYRLPARSVVFRDEEAFVFTIERETEPEPVAAADASATPPPEKGSAAAPPADGPPAERAETYRARRVSLPRYVQQGPDVIVPRDAVQLERAVVRGQHRLIDGQRVRIVPDEAKPAALRPPAVSAQAPDDSANY